jgi:type IV fimbrial biogenesis protein FimT
MFKLAGSRQSEAARPERIGGERGFTLLELITTLTVASILLTVAVPSFFNTMRNSRAAANANELVSALSVARSEAIRRGARVSVCRTSNGTTCNFAGGATWATGWLVFVDTAGSDTAAPNANPGAANILRVWPATSGNAAITTESSGADDLPWVRFLPRGTVRVPAGVTTPVTYEIRVEGCEGTQAREIQLNTIGRTSVSATACS